MGVFSQRNPHMTIFDVRWGWGAGVWVETSLTEWLLGEGHDSLGGGSERWKDGGGEERLWRDHWQHINNTGSQTSQHPVCSLHHLLQKKKANPFLFSLKSSYLWSYAFMFHFMQNEVVFFLHKSQIKLFFPYITFFYIFLLNRRKKNWCLVRQVITKIISSNIKFIASVFLCSLRWCHCSVCREKRTHMHAWFPSYPNVLYSVVFSLTWISLSWLSPKLITAMG